MNNPIPGSLPGRTVSGRRLASVLAALLLGAMAPPAMAEHTLNAAEIKALLVGHTSQGTTRNGGTWEASHETDGTYVVRVLDSDWNDHGTWRIDGDTWCTERTKKSETCTRIIHNGDGSYTAKPAGNTGSGIDFRIVR